MSSHRRNKKWGDCDIFTQIDDKYPHHVSWGYGKKNEKDAAAGSYVSVTGKLGDFVYVSTDDYEGTAMFPSTLIPEVVKRLRAIYKQVQSKGQ